jgi:hypothetical protein
MIFNGMIYFVLSGVSRMETILEEMISLSRCSFQESLLCSSQTISHIHNPYIFVRNGKLWFAGIIYRKKRTIGMIPFIFLDSELYVDFRTLTNMASVSRSTLYRRLIRNVPRKTFGNKKLILYSDILSNPKLSKIISSDGEPTNI